MKQLYKAKDINNITNILFTYLMLVRMYTKVFVMFSVFSIERLDLKQINRGSILL